jgi:hypothetical protein
MGWRVRQHIHADALLSPQSMRKTLILNPTSRRPERDFMRAVHCGARRQDPVGTAKRGQGGRGSHPSRPLRIAVSCLQQSAIFALDYDCVPGIDHDCRNIVPPSGGAQDRSCAGNNGHVVALFSSWRQARWRRHYRSTDALSRAREWPFLGSASPRSTAMGRSSMTRTLHWFPQPVSVGCCFWLRRRSNYQTGYAQLERMGAGGPSSASGDTPDAEDFVPRRHRTCCIRHR